MWSWPISSGRESCKYKGERGFRFVFSLWFPLFVDNGSCSGFGKTDTRGFNLLVHNDGPGWARTRTPDCDCELR
jgi:hypothetical protein